MYGNASPTAAAPRTRTRSAARRGASRRATRSACSLARGGAHGRAPPPTCSIETSIASPSSMSSSIASRARRRRREAPACMLTPGWRWVSRRRRGGGERRRRTLPLAIAFISFWSGVVFLHLRRARGGVSAPRSPVCVLADGAAGRPHLKKISLPSCATTFRLIVSGFSSLASSPMAVFSLWLLRSAWFAVVAPSRSGFRLARRDSTAVSSDQSSFAASPAALLASTMRSASSWPSRRRPRPHRATPCGTSARGGAALRDAMCAASTRQVQLATTSRRDDALAALEHRRRRTASSRARSTSSTRPPPSSASPCLRWRRRSYGSRWGGGD